MRLRSAADHFQSLLALLVILLLLALEALHLLLLTLNDPLLQFLLHFHIHFRLKQMETFVDTYYDCSKCRLNRFGCMWKKLVQKVKGVSNCTYSFTFYQGQTRELFEQFANILPTNAELCHSCPPGAPK